MYKTNARLNKVLKTVLDRLPAGTHVGWWGARDLPSGAPAPQVRLALPSRSSRKVLQSYCAEQGIELSVSR